MGKINYNTTTNGVALLFFVIRSSPCFVCRCTFFHSYNNNRLNSVFCFSLKHWFITISLCAYMGFIVIFGNGYITQQK